MKGSAALLAIAGLLAQASTLAQQPPVVYKCENAGKVTYSDEPCLGASRVDVTPTKGMETYKGAIDKNPRALQDRGNERHREAVGKALRPITGMNAQQWDAAVRRHELAPADKAECRRLDAELPRLEADLRELSKRPQTDPARGDAELELFRARKRFKELGC